MPSPLMLTLGKTGRKASLGDLHKLLSEANALGLSGKKIHKVNFPAGERLVVVMHFSTEGSAPSAEESVSS